ncbi:RHS repeat domain-containing protein [Granulibacter bethesdensis]|nr:RHS repeat domain-containing protein [Granulibacter bethesdensis]
MISTFEPALHAGTPTISVLDGRGKTVRELAWLRSPGADAAAGSADAEILISQHEYDAAGRLLSSVDPRLHVSRQTDATLAPNFAWSYDLSGRALRTESVDQGRTVVLHDAEGRPMQIVTATGLVRSYRYESADRPGRLLAVEEKEADTTVVVERLVWAESGQEAKDYNLAGQCVRHYDPAGLMELESLSLTGTVLSQSRRLLPAETEVDWREENEDDWQAALDGDAYRTTITVDAANAMLTQTDARGNRQRIVYNVAGQLESSWLTLKEGEEQVIVRSVDYTADGLTLSEEHGNGVMTEFDYDLRTTRLTEIVTRRPAASKEARLMQHLSYDYDPAGNVVSITNDAETTDFWYNQEVEPKNSYSYDTLYRLTKATGRQKLSSRQQDSRLPDLSALMAGPGACTNYSRSYSYDHAGNLTRIRHAAAKGHNYTTDIVVSNRSNRAVLQRGDLAPGDVDGLFDANGRQKALQTGQTLAWNGRGELARLTVISREEEQDDCEWYRYDSAGARIAKVSERRVGETTSRQRVIYLPGIELRVKGEGTAATEEFQVITIGGSGCAQVRVLHWERNKPADIVNDQVRYGYGNLIGSLLMELDSDGNLISQEEYYPFGGTAMWAARNQTEANYKTIRYSGKERDDSGLYYHGHRYYQPWIARWLSADPGGTVDGLNLYRYVRNNPVLLHDPDGRAPFASWFRRRVVPPILHAPGPSAPNQVPNVWQFDMSDINLRGTPTTIGYRGILLQDYATVAGKNRRFYEKQVRYIESKFKTYSAYKHQYGKSMPTQNPTVERELKRIHVQHDSVCDLDAQRVTEIATRPGGQAVLDHFNRRRTGTQSTFYSPYVSMSNSAWVALSYAKSDPFTGGTHPGRFQNQPGIVYRLLLAHDSNNNFPEHIGRSAVENDLPVRGGTRIIAWEKWAIHLQDIHNNHPMNHWVRVDRRINPDFRA